MISKIVRHKKLKKIYRQSHALFICLDAGTFFLINCSKKSTRWNKLLATLTVSFKICYIEARRIAGMQIFDDPDPGFRKFKIASCLLQSLQTGRQTCSQTDS